jgi:uncharacterized protein (DUF1778 family)
MDEKKIRSTIYLTEKNRELLRTAAYLFRKSKTDMMNEALENYLGKIIEEKKISKF